MTQSQAPHTQRSPRPHTTKSAGVSAKIIGLALPTFGQLIAEPVFILIDTAIVGHIGDDALAGLSIGSTIILTVVGLCIFLAYSTTSQVAQLIGEGKRTQGLQAGINGMWLALVLGTIISIVVAVFAEPLCWAMGARGDVLTQALLYTRALVFSIPGALLVYAANGIFRGLFKVRVTLVAAIGGAIVNTILDFAFVYGFGWGIAGSGVATLISQWLMAGFLTVLACRWAVEEGARITPQVRGILANATDGIPLFIRSLALRAALVATVAAAAHMGTLVLASYQAVNSTWNLALNMLDAIGIAGQSIVGEAIGRRRREHSGTEEIHALVSISARAGAIMGIAVGAALIAVSFAAPGLFTANSEIQHLIVAGMIAVGIFCPMQGWVWALDGVLIGAGDYRYLAVTSIISSGVYLLALGGLMVTTGDTSIFGSGTSNPTFLVIALWLVFNLFFMGARAVSNGLRARSDTWLRKAK
ncbi:MAG: MATE family efflux transporter [Bifidobacteriaceae bacterium]|jgi:putative MATE family efflux protein|nr:MATE family efflux transporter [Bifidobacteriaceae bacterium]